MLVRIGRHRARVANLSPPRGEGWKVKVSDLDDVQGIAPVKVPGVPFKPSERLSRPIRWFALDKSLKLPYGLPDLDPRMVTDGQGRIRCYVKDCNHFLLPPRKGFSGEVCPSHGIRCHRSRTYTYPKGEAWRNVIAERELFTALHTHPFKFESRCHYEKSEDALTASVFLELQRVGCLKELARWVTGQQVDENEITLCLWGIDTSRLEPFELLVAARNRFERGLPAGRPFSEPDCLLYAPGKFLLIVEAKLTAPNTYVVPGEGRKSPISLTHDEVVNRYRDLECHMVNTTLAATRPVPQQLYRYAVMAEWQALMSDTGAIPFLCNLTRHGCETASQDDFRELLNPRFSERFVTATWEGIYQLTHFRRKELARLRSYLENKTVNLQQAFDLGRSWSA